MKTIRQARHDAKELYHLCLVDGVLDEGRVRLVVRQMIDARRSGGLTILSRFQRLVRLDRERHRAEVESAVPLAAEVRERIEEGLVRKYGRRVAASFAVNPALIGGVLIKVGSDVYDGSVRGGLAALESRF